MQNLKLEAFEKNIKGKRVALVGIEKGNISLIDYLYNLMAKVTVFDERKISDIDENIIKKIKDYGFDLVTGENALHFLRGYNIIFRSPDCLPTTLQLMSEQKRGSIVTSELEMFMNTCTCKVIGITGSNGKTTTATLIYKMLERSKEHKRKRYSNIRS